MCCGSQSAAEAVMAEAWHKFGGSCLHCVYLGGQLVTLCLSAARSKYLWEMRWTMKLQVMASSSKVPPPKGSTAF